LSYWRTPSLQTIEASLPSLDVYLKALTADKLKKLARRWVGKESYKLNKESAFLAARKAWGDACAMRKLADDLSDFERAGLGLIKLRGGRAAYTEDLAGELLLLGLPFKGLNDAYGRFSGYDSAHFSGVNALLETGLLMRVDGYGYPIDRYYPALAVFANAALLAGIEPLPPKPLAIQPATEGSAVVIKRPGELLLTFVSLARALGKIGGVTLSAKGLRTKPGLTKLAKALGFKAEPADKSPTPLADPLGFYLSLWEAAGLFQLDPLGRTLNLKQTEADELIARPYPEQAKTWAKAYRSLYGWIECEPEPFYLYDDHELQPSKLNALRGALLLGLAALPDPNAWYRIQDLSDALYRRIGNHLCLGYSSSFHAPYKTPADQIPALKKKWEEERHQAWRKREGVWIARAIAGPLFHLGLADLAHAEGSKAELADLFRLTEGGRAATSGLFRPEAKPAAPPAPMQPCWVVQPNFEIILYLEQASPKQLNFIERLAERRQVGEATAVYRLTREATYQALESGMAADSLLQTLERSCRHPLPENVARTLADWAARRERLSVRLNARILEFDQNAARDAALATGQLRGTAVGERLVLVSALGRGFRPQATIAYEPPLQQCLAVRETGEVAIDVGSRDLLIKGELAAYCEAIANDSARVTRASVQQAVERGYSANEILSRLSRRARLALPPLLGCAIRAWAGGRAAPGPLAVPTVPILMVTDRDVAEAIAASPSFKPYLVNRLGSQAFLVKAGLAEEITAKLLEFGFAVGNEFMPGVRVPEAIE